MLVYYVLNFQYAVKIITIHRCCFYFITFKTFKRGLVRRLSLSNQGSKGSKKHLEISYEVIILLNTTAKMHSFIRNIKIPFVWRHGDNYALLYECHP